MQGFEHHDFRQSGMSQVCYQSVTQSPQFDVSFSEKLLKIVATRGELFSLKLTTVWRRGLRTDRLGKGRRGAKALPDP